jgi:hypothetical protein
VRWWWWRRACESCMPVPATRPSGTTSSRRWTPRPSSAPSRSPSASSGTPTSRASFLGPSAEDAIFAYIQESLLPANEPITLPVGRRAILNVGSVGHPRDRDPRAAWLLYDDATGTVDSAPAHVRHRGGSGPHPGCRAPPFPGLPAGDGVVAGDSRLRRAYTESRSSTVASHSSHPPRPARRPNRERDP